MQGLAKKKEELERVAEAPKKKQAQAVHASLSTEGPMQLKDESRKIEEMGRASFEKSVSLELEALKKRLQEKLRLKKKEPEKKKPRYGWAVAGGGSEPPAGSDEEESGEEKQ
jgi:hypothetical protein